VRQQDSSAGQGTAAADPTRRADASRPGNDGAQTMRRFNRQLEAMYAAEPAAWRGLVLEAGGGSFSHFALPPGSTGIVLDIDHGQLVRNTSGAPGVQGDLQQLPVAAASCSMVVCFNVIEHLDRPEAAIAEMARALVPGGLMLLGFPERNSLKGLITRATPVGVHRAFYRWVVGKRDRGGAHFDAFETPFRPIVSGKRVAQRLGDLGFRVVQAESYDGSREYGLTTGSLKRRLFALPYYAICAAGRLLSGGRWQAERSDALLLARRGANVELGE
jgi:SAM-dependent methyltransferase